MFNDETGETITESLEDMILMELLDIGDKIAANIRAMKDGAITQEDFDNALEYIIKTPRYIIG